jgi:uroporphyrinogen decarboxylase
MNPRERVLIALKHEEPDRVPIDLGGTDSSGIHIIPYIELRKFLKLPHKPVRIINFIQQRADVHDDILNLFNVDVIDITRVSEPCGSRYALWRYILGDGTAFEGITNKWILWRREDDIGYEAEIPSYIQVVKSNNDYIAYIGNKILAKMPRNGYYFWGVIDKEKNILYNARTVDDIKKFDWDSYKVSDQFLNLLRERAEYLYKNTSYALAFVEGATLHEWAQGVRGWDKWLSDLRIRKSLAEAILDIRLEIVKYNVEKYVDVFGEFVHVIGFGDDFGTEEGPQIDVKTFREFYKHRYEELFSIVKKRSRAYIFFHSCGSIYPLIKEFIDIGVDIINPVQISAKGMDPEKLKKEFGDQITFWGGVDTQHVLPFAKPNEVIEHVKKLIEIFAPKGGFILAPVHNIQPPTPPENIVAMFKTAYEYGKYPIKR